MVTERIKKAIICKHVQEFDIDTDLVQYRIPQFGDVGVFRIMEIGKHTSIQGETGNNSYLFEGDLIMAAFGGRYATNQFEGYVPDEILETYQILGKGGAVGTFRSMHYKLKSKGTTNIKMVGYVTDLSGKVINTKYLDGTPRKRFNPHKPRPYQVILSIGSSMDSGKTTSAAYFCRGLSLAGKRVAYLKLTGTVYSRDRSFVRDCGADAVADFSHLGYPSTFQVAIPEILDIYETLLDRVEAHQPEIVVVEIADGLLQQETFALLTHNAFMSTVSSVLFSAGDSMGAIGGLNFLSQHGIRPFAMGGLFMASPLLAKEVEQNTNIAILNLDDLSSPGVVKWVAPFREKILA